VPFPHFPVFTAPALAAPAHRLLVLLPFLFAETARADTTNVPGISSGSIAQGLFGLLLVIGLLLGAAYLLRRLGGAAPHAHAGPMRMVAGLAVGARERILLLEIGDDWVVIGVTATQMRTLHTLPKGILPSGGEKAGSPAFAHWLKQFAERKNNDR